MTTNTPVRRGAGRRSGLSPASTEPNIKPTPLPVLAENIPPELKERPQWVLWRYEPRKSKETGEPVFNADGTPIWTKPPRWGAGPYDYASPTDPDTWLSFEEVWAAYKRGGGFDGIGFVVTADDPFTFIDLDHCRDPQTKTIKKWAMDVVRVLGTRTEKSPSGDGLRLIVRGRLPVAGANRRGFGPDQRGGVEAYTDKHYLTLTGHVAPQYTSIEDRQTELDEFYARYLASKSARTGTRSSQGRADIATPETNAGERYEAMAERVERAHPDLWAGDTSSHGNDHSKAVMALVRHIEQQVGADARTIDGVFRLSGLFQPAKWDKKHRADGATFGEMTIEKVVEDSSAARDVTDLANAHRLAQLHGNELMYVHGLKQWFVWEGRRWVADTDDEVMRRTHDVIRAIRQQAVEDAEWAGKEWTDKLWGWARTSQSATKLSAMVTVASSLPAFAVSADKLDADPYLLNIENGTLDLRTGERREHRREDLITKLAPVEYKPRARSKLLDDFLRKAIPNADTRSYVQRLVGYTLQGVRDQDVLLLVLGPGGTGKSTFLEALASMMGDYAGTASFDAFTARRGDGGERPRPELVSLLGTRLVTVSEVDPGQRLSAALLKRVTGGDTITARKLYSAPVTFRPQFVPWFIANDRPHVPHTDTGMWRRIREIPFKVRMDPPDETVRIKLQSPENRAALLAWALQGLKDFRVNGLEIPPEVAVATTDYREEMDTVKEFIDEQCVVQPEVHVRAGELYEAYLSWCRRRGIQNDLTSTAFGTAVSGRYLKRRTSLGWRYEGLKLAQPRVHS